MGSWIASKNNSRRVPGCLVSVTKNSRTHFKAGLNHSGRGEGVKTLSKCLLRRFRRSPQASDRSKTLNKHGACFDVEMGAKRI